jgi:hypothetical protein
VFLGDLYTIVTRQNRDLFERYARKQHLDGKCVTEHMRMAPLCCSVLASQISDLEESAKTPLPITDY